MHFTASKVRTTTVMRPAEPAIRHWHQSPPRVRNAGMSRCAHRGIRHERDTSARNCRARVAIAAYKDAEQRAVRETSVELSLPVWTPRSAAAALGPAGSKRMYEADVPIGDSAISAALIGRKGANLRRLERRAGDGVTFRVYSKLHGRLVNVSPSACDTVFVSAESADALRYATHLIGEELCKLTHADDSLLS